MDSLAVGWAAGSVEQKTGGRGVACAAAAPRWGTAAHGRGCGSIDENECATMTGTSPMPCASSHIPGGICQPFPDMMGSGNNPNRESAPASASSSVVPRNPFLCWPGPQRHESPAPRAPPGSCGSLSIPDGARRDFGGLDGARYRLRQSHQRDRRGRRGRGVPCTATGGHQPGRAGQRG